MFPIVAISRVLLLNCLFPYLPVYIQLSPRPSHLSFIPFLFSLTFFQILFPFCSVLLLLVDHLGISVISVVWLFPAFLPLLALSNLTLFPFLCGSYLLPAFSSLLVPVVILITLTVVNLCYAGFLEPQLVFFSSSIRQMFTSSVTYIATLLFCVPEVGPDFCLRVTSWLPGKLA